MINKSHKYLETGSPNPLLGRGPRGGGGRGKVIFIFLLLFLPSIYIYGEDPPQTFELTIVHTNDYHGYDYELLARKSTLIRQLRQQSPNLLLLEAGDLYGNSKYHRQLWGRLEIDELNYMEYDAWTIGNHELKSASSEDSVNYRLGELIHRAKFPTLCANVLQRPDSSFIRGVRPYTILKRNGLRIAVIGVTTVKARGYAQSSNKIVLNPMPVARKYLKESIPLSDIQILLSHAGINSDKPMADTLGAEGLDAVVGGDSHIPLFEPLVSVSNIPIVQAGGAENQYLGVLRLWFTKQENEWKLSRFEGELLKLTDDIVPDKEVLDIAKRHIEPLEKPANQD